MTPVLDYPLDPARPIAEAVRRSAAGLLDDALRRLDDTQDLDAAVHESRKRLKEVRSLLRLFRTTLVDGEGEAVRDRANATLRDAARGLSGARDAAVAVKTLEKLKSQYADGLAVDAFAGLLHELRGRHGRIAAAVEGGAVDESRRAVAGVRGEVESWRVTWDGWNAVRPGLRRIYERGRSDFKDHAKGRHDDPESWHDWRKRAKDLRYAAEFLSSGLSAGEGPALVRAAKDLTDLLGDDHDLQELVRIAAEVGADDPGAIDLLGSLAEARRAALQASAVGVGRRVYREKPGAFVKRLGGEWGRPATD